MRAIDQASRRGFYAVEWVTNMDYDMKGIFEIVKQKHGSCQQNFRLATLDARLKQSVVNLVHSFKVIFNS